MDLPLPTDLLQNTSPNEDPATMSALSAAFTAQASQLATHHHQLTRLTSLTEELVTAMQNLQTSSADTSSASASPSLAPAPVLQTAASPRLALPEKFDGNPGKCKGFILQCSLFLNQQPSPHSTDASKISFVSSLLTGRALDWITAVWRTDGSAFRSYDEFLRDFQAVFEHSKGGKGAEDLLLELAQGRTSAAEYALDFRTLAAQTNWTDNSLKVIFRRGLSHDLQTELACRDEGKDFNQFVHLAIQIEKCDFHQTSISFLGYIISPGGVAMDEGKVKAVVEWPRPTKLKELQRFLGFANFYRRFIRGFSMVAEPLTALVRKGTSCLPWNEEATKAFSRLKQAFTSAPILHHPDPELPFVVEVDASSTGLGAVLSQRQGSPPKLYPCAYYSKKLSSAERNYDVGDRELLAMKAAFEEWRHWLEGSTHPFLVLTDHKNLEYLRTTKRLNPRQARWSLFFSRFQFTITFRPGSKNTKADSLSRQFDSETSIKNPETILSPDLVIGPIQWDIETELELANAHTGIHPACPPGKLYVPETLREKVLKHVHALPSSGHPGITATIHLLQNRFWWSTLSQDVSWFVQQCKTCNIQKSSRLLPAGLLQPLPLPQRPWSHIAIDFITDLPPSDGHTTILTVIDRFSKACRLIPLSKLPTALQTAEYLCNLVFRFYGLPEDIVSDRGAQFTSHVWSAFFQMLQVNVSLTSGYHPQANGQVERLNQEVSRFLRSYCQLHQKDWSRYLMWAEYAQNSIQKQSTGLTPFQCVLGFQPPLFPWSGEPTNVPAVNDWLNRSEETWNLAHTHLQRAVNRGKRQADRHRRSNPEYLPGQWVWLSTRNLRLNLPCKKLSPRFVGPYKILRQITPVSFRLALPRHLRISPTFHVSLLKPAMPPTEEGRGSPSISGWLGGLQSRRTILGQFKGHPRSYAHARVSL